MTEDFPAIDPDAVQWAGRSLYYDKQGQPISMDAWGLLLEDMEYKRIGLDTYGTPQRPSRTYDPSVSVVTVSTVWSGVDYAFGRGAPVIFESLVFGGDHDDARRRYCTEAEAVAGHREAVENIAAGRSPWPDDN